MAEEKGEKKKEEEDPDGSTTPVDPYQGYYYPPPPSRKKDPISLKLVVGIIVIIFVVVFSYVLIVSLVLMSEPEKDEQTYRFDAIIKDGGYYRYTLDDDDYFYNDNTEAKIEISSTNGSHFDVYIMDEGQFASAYWTKDDGALSFASIRSWENVQEVENKFDLPPSTGDDIYLVIDNKMTNITKSDADPKGEITVSVKVTMISDYEPFL